MKIKNTFLIISFIVINIGQFIYYKNKNELNIILLIFAILMICSLIYNKFKN